VLWKTGAEFSVFCEASAKHSPSRTLGEPIPLGMTARLTIRDLEPQTPSGMTASQHSLNQIPDAKFRNSKPIGFELI